MITRGELDKFLLAHEQSAEAICGTYDEAILGMTTDFRVVYDMDKLVSIIMQDQGLGYDCAMEHLNFNIIGACGGDRCPIFMQTKF